MPPRPAPFARIRAQLENEARVLGGADRAKLIAWEWLSCLSPFMPATDPRAAAAAALYSAYSAYVRGDTES